MAGAAIGVVVLFLAAASFGVNANTDSNDGECVLLLLVVFFFFFFFSQSTLGFRASRNDAFRHGLVWYSQP